MKVELVFKVYARMTIEVENDEELQGWEANFGDIDHPFQIEHPEYSELLTIEEIEDIE